MATKTKTERVFYIKLEGEKIRVNDNGDKLTTLIDELGWDYQRLGESGREIYDKICTILATVKEVKDETN